MYPIINDFFQFSIMFIMFTHVAQPLVLSYTLLGIQNGNWYRLINLFIKTFEVSSIIYILDQENETQKDSVICWTYHN